MQQHSLQLSDEALLHAFEELERTGKVPPDIAGSLKSRLQRLLELESDFARELQQAKLRSLKELAYGASHEINNPLANISTRAQALLAEEKHPEKRKKLATIVAQAFRAHEMISDLMLFAKPQALSLQTVELQPLVATVIEEVADEARDQNTKIEVAIEPPTLTLVADATQLAVAIKALLRNALEALGEGGMIHLRAMSHSDQIHIAIEDDGPGIEDERIAEHLFDPFFSGRESGRGLGFGLSKCWRIAELHGGSIQVDSEPGSGSIFTLKLPVQPASPANQGESAR